MSSRLHKREPLSREFEAAINALGVIIQHFAFIILRVAGLNIL
jgi:hypothetical protein